MMNDLFDMLDELDQETQKESYEEKQEDLTILARIQEITEKLQLMHGMKGSLELELELAGEKIALKNELQKYERMGYWISYLHPDTQATSISERIDELYERYKNLKTRTLGQGTNLQDTLRYYDEIEKTKKELKNYASMGYHVPEI